MTQPADKRAVVTALGWSFAMKAGFQGLSWVMTLAVIRVLAPGDYGLMALAQVGTNLLLGFAGLGLGDALIQRQGLTDATRASVFGLLLLVSVILMGTLMAAASTVAWWYGDPRLTPSSRSPASLSCSAL